MSELAMVFGIAAWVMLLWCCSSCHCSNSRSPEERVEVVDPSRWALHSSLPLYQPPTYVPPPSPPPSYKSRASVDHDVIHLEHLPSLTETDDIESLETFESQDDLPTEQRLLARLTAAQAQPA